MTDKEIMDALEFCKDCSININWEIIDLISRQQAEIKWLKEALQTQTDILESGANSNEFCFEEDKIRAEAIIEAAEKLKEKTSVISFTSYSDDYIKGYCDAVDFYDIKIDNIIKEMESIKDEQI